MPDGIQSKDDIRCRMASRFDEKKQYISATPAADCSRGIWTAEAEHDFDFCQTVWKDIQMKGL